MPKKIFTEQEKNKIIYEYSINKVSAKKLGQQYGCSAPTLLKNLKNWGIEPNQKKLDLTNQKFNLLTVIKPAPKRNDRYTRWICKCECGNLVEVRTDYLTSGHTTSCGCEKQKHFCKTIKLNCSYGKLTPIKFDSIKQQYLCQCECGNKIYVIGYNLSNGNTQSCGCLKSKGEFKINQLLIQMGIDFKTQYTFEDCRFPETNRLAYFDYAIFNNQKLILLIEYDGIQHEVGWNNNQESLSLIKQHDLIKNDYCIINKIPLKRISYKELGKITKQYLNKIIEEAQEVAE